MRSRRYYTLIAGLPKIDHFEWTERLPITRPRLEQRLGLLDPVDRKQLARAEALVSWSRQPLTRTDEQLAVSYSETMVRISDTPLREFIAMRMDQRTILAALRRRRLGMPAPSREETWGVGQWVAVIRERWDQPDFKLGYVHKWIPQARALLTSGDALALERLLMNVAWRHLGRIADAHTFGFERVFTYLFKWDILRRWLTHDPVAAKLRFSKLISGVIGEQQHLLA